MESNEVISEPNADLIESNEEEADDKHDNDSGIQKDEKDEEETQNDPEKVDPINEKRRKKKKSKIGSPTKSPKKANSRSVSPNKNPKSPQKSPKKRKRKVFPKPEQKECDAAIIKNPHFDAQRSANRMFNAMKGISTDEKVIIEIFATHDVDQRSKIKKAYNQLSKKDLISDLKEQLGGLFCEVMNGLVMEPLRFETHCLQDMVAKFEPNLGFEKSFVSILALKNQKELDGMRKFYKLDFQADLDEDVMSKVTDVEGYSGLIKALLTQERDSPETGVDVEAAKLVAQKLGENGIKGDTPRTEMENENDDDNEEKEEKRNEDDTEADDQSKKEESNETKVSVEDIPTKEDTNNFSDLEELLFCRSPNQVKETLKEYEAAAMVDMLSSIKMELPEISAEAFSSLVEILTDPGMYFAQELDEAIQGLGSDDDTIIRIFVSRSEKDLKKIAERFKEFSGRELDKALEQDTGGDYKKLLLKMLDPEMKIA